MNRETTIAYIAGLFDGEGTIRFQTGKEYCQVKVEMSHLPTVQFLHEMCGGTLDKPRTRLNAAGTANRKTTQTWWLSAQRDVLWFLLEIEPYLRAKRPEALAAIARINEALSARAA